MKRTFNITWSELRKYNEENVKKVVPTGKEGVYRLSYQKEERYIIFYVGRGNLQERLSAHLQPSESNECIKQHLKDYDCYFRFAIIEDEKDRMDVEWWMVKHYKPKCNDPEKVAHSGKHDEICVNPTNNASPICYKTGSSL